MKRHILDDRDRDLYARYVCTEGVEVSTLGGDVREDDILLLPHLGFYFWEVFKVVQIGREIVLLISPFALFYPFRVPFNRSQSHINLRPDDRVTVMRAAYAN